MTPSELKRNVELTGSMFFKRSNMAFAGDTMGNFGVRMAQPKISLDGSITPVWELYRKKATNMGLKSSFFFNAETFERIRKNG